MTVARVCLTATIISRYCGETWAGKKTFAKQTFTKRRPRLGYDQCRGDKIFFHQLQTKGKAAINNQDVLLHVTVKQINIT